MYLMYYEDSPSPSPFTFHLPAMLNPGFAKGLLIPDLRGSFQRVVNCSFSLLFYLEISLIAPNISKFSNIYLAETVVIVCRISINNRKLNPAAVNRTGREAHKCYNKVSGAVLAVRVLVYIKFESDLQIGPAFNNFIIVRVI